MFALGVLVLGSGNGRFVKEAVSIDDATLRNLLRLELSFSEEIASSAVAKMVVGGDGQRLDTGVDKVLSEDGLEPDLRSSLPMKARLCSASSTTPGTNVFWRALLMKGSPSRIAATAKRVDGETSEWEFLFAFNRLSAVSPTPEMMSLYLSVLAVQKMNR